MSNLNTTDFTALSLLFTDDLYAKADALPKQQQTEVNDGPDNIPSFDYLGENKKYFLILVDDEKQKILSKNDLDLLTKILLAKKMELRDVAVVNVNKLTAINFEQLREFFSNNKLILFGINPAVIGLNEIGANQVVLKDNTKILATYSLPELSNDKEKKAALWAVLQSF